jgi:hypothetical protein
MRMELNQASFKTAETETKKESTQKTMTDNVSTKSCKKVCITRLLEGMRRFLSLSLVELNHL